MRDFITSGRGFISVYAIGCLSVLILYPIMIKKLEWSVRTGKKTFWKRFKELRVQYIVNIIFSWVSIIMHLTHFAKYKKSLRKKVAKEEAGSEETSDNEV